MPSGSASPGRRRESPDSSGWKATPLDEQPADTPWGTGPTRIDPALTGGDVTRLLDDQRRRWAQGERVPAEAYLPGFPGGAADAEAFLDVVYQEVLLREQL